MHGGIGYLGVESGYGQGCYDGSEHWDGDGNFEVSLCGSIVWDN